MKAEGPAFCIHALSLRWQWHHRLYWLGPSFRLLHPDFWYLPHDLCCTYSSFHIHNSKFQRYPPQLYLPAMHCIFNYVFICN